MVEDCWVELGSGGARRPGGGGGLELGRGRRGGRKDGMGQWMGVRYLGR